MGRDDPPGRPLSFAFPYADKPPACPYLGTSSFFSNSSGTSPIVKIHPHLYPLPRGEGKCDRRCREALTKRLPMWCRMPYLTGYESAFALRRAVCVRERFLESRSCGPEHTPRLSGEVRARDNSRRRQTRRGRSEEHTSELKS